MPGCRRGPSRILGAPGRLRIRRVGGAPRVARFKLPSEALWTMRRRGRMALAACRSLRVRQVHPGAPGSGLTANYATRRLRRRLCRLLRLRDARKLNVNLPPAGPGPAGIHIYTYIPASVHTSQCRPPRRVVHWQGPLSASGPIGLCASRVVVDASTAQAPRVAQAQATVTVSSRLLRSAEGKCV